MVELTRDEAARRAGVRPDTWSAYVTRGQAPAPRRHLGRTPLWDSGEVDRWLERRPGHGGRPPSSPRDPRHGSDEESSQ
jgi:predicted DNA-binding transcriptional regulator AlpA